MSGSKPRSLRNIEEKMLVVEPGSFRFRTLEAARDFKSSWIALGQYLFTIQKDKLFREWGFQTFEAYCAGEVGIRKNTALKLLRSYSFLEREEPTFLKQSLVEDERPTRIPSVDSVNTLRLAKQSNRLKPSDYEALRGDVLERAADESDVRKKVRFILKRNPAPASKELVLRRSIASLKRVKEDLAENGFPSKFTRQIGEVIDELEEMQE